MSQMDETGDENINNDSVTQAWFTSKCDKLAYLTNGYHWKQGQWTSDEIMLLQSNIHKYCSVNNIKDPTDIIFNANKNRKDFYKQIALGLKRPLFSVYRRVIRMYNQKNYIGKYSPEELLQLKDLRKKHGSDWTAIGNLIGRSASSVRDRCRLIKDKCKHGKWSSDEEYKLCEIVYHLSKTSPGEDITSGLSWSEVARYVGSRNDKQCRNKWLNNLNWKQKGGVHWTREDDKLLLNRLTYLNNKEETDINWEQIAHKWPSVRSPQWLRCKWWAMKRKVPNYNCLSFKENLQFVLSLFELDCDENQQFEENEEPLADFSTSEPLQLQPLQLQPLQLQPLQLQPLQSTLDNVAITLETCTTEQESNNVDNEITLDHSYHDSGSNHGDSCYLETLATDVEAIYYNQHLLFSNLDGSVLFSDDFSNDVESCVNEISETVISEAGIDVEL